MEFRILGPLEVVDEGRPVELERRLSRALLAYLLLHANEAVSSDRLVDQLWGDAAPKTAVASLQNTVSRLRKAIGADRIRLEPAGYVLRVDPESFDLAQFDRLVREAKNAPPRTRLDLLRAALALWRGRPLEDLAFEAFAHDEIGLLEERYLEAQEERIAAQLELGAGAELVGELEDLAREQPLRERLRAQLMLALYRAGRQADALGVFADARTTLLDELGLEPSEELRTLQRRILEHDRSLQHATADVARTVSRRIVTVFFCDLVDSTRLALQLDAEAYRALLTTYFDAVSSAVEAHGGTVEKFIGDAVMAVFGIPELHEDDAMRAVRAATDARAAVLRLNDGSAHGSAAALAVRIGINTGEVLVAEGATGAPVNIAAHLEKRAGRNEIVLGAETYRLVRGAIDAEEIDLGDGLHAWRVDLVTAAAPVARRLDVPLIGRKKELRRLLSAFHRARKNESCVVATIVGEAGLGKTRLAREIVDATQADARVVVGRCVSYGAGATYLPIAEIVRSVVPEPTVAGIVSLLGDADDAAHVAQRVGEVVGFTDAAAAPGETLWAVRRLFEELAGDGPLVVVLDDIHWAEPTLLDLVEYVGQWAEGSILLLCLARPELLDARPGWGGPTSTGFIVRLDPLPADDVAALVDTLADGAVAPDIHAKIVEHSGGNPLFAEQLLALASEVPDASLDRAPSTVEALIASRLDTLPPTELDVLQRASVVGRRFSADDLDKGALAGLERRGLVHTTPEGYRFHHVLVRDVAYRGIPKARRADLHEAVAKRGGADEIVGFHYEQAHRYLLELARDDERASALAERGGDHLGAAGIRAWKRADAPATVNLLSRALALVPAAAEWACELAVALSVRRETDRARETLSRAIDVATAADDERTALRAQLELGMLTSIADPRSVNRLLETATSAIRTFEQHGDDRALGRAWLCVGHVRGGFRCEYGAWEDAARRASHHYTRAGWSASTALGELAIALFFGPSPVGRAIDECNRLLTVYRGDRASEANVLPWLGALEATTGRFADARDCVASAREIHRDLGHLAEANSARAAGVIAILEGRPEDAIDDLRDVCTELTSRNATAVLATVAAELADVLVAARQVDEAESWLDAAAAAATPDDVDASFASRYVGARLRTAQNRISEAEALFDEASQLIATTDAIGRRADCLAVGAEIARASGHEERARQRFAAALELYRQKGNLVRVRDVEQSIQLVSVR